MPHLYLTERKTKTKEEKTNWSVPFSHNTCNETTWSWLLILCFFFFHFAMTYFTFLYFSHCVLLAVSFVFLLFFANYRYVLISNLRVAESSRECHRHYENWKENVAKKNNEKPERVTCGTTIKALTRRLQSDAFVSLRSTVLWLLQLFIRTFIIIYHHQYFFWLHIIVITLETFGSSLWRKWRRVEREIRAGKL